MRSALQIGAAIFWIGFIPYSGRASLASPLHDECLVLGKPLHSEELPQRRLASDFSHLAPPSPKRLPALGIAPVQEPKSPLLNEKATTPLTIKGTVDTNGEATKQVVQFAPQGLSIPPEASSIVIGTSPIVLVAPSDPPETEEQRFARNLPLGENPPILMTDETSIEGVQWWSPLVSQPLLQKEVWLSFDLSTIITDALNSAPRFTGVLEKREIALAEVVQEDAVFDARWVLDSKAGRTSDPVGNTLVTGGPPRLRELDWSSNVGLSRRTRLGTQWDVKQQFGLSDSNSVFFIPPNQGNSRLTISMNHPLLAGSGRLYNERLVVEARLDSDITWHDVQSEMQVNLADIMLAYWQLYSARCKLIQQRSLIDRGRKVQSLVASRNHFDTGRIERLRVDEQMRRREDQLLRIEAALRNEQARLVRNVGTRQLTQNHYDELIPRDLPSCPEVTINLENAFVTSLNHRPDLAIVASELEKAALEVRVSRREILPKLNALVETYVAGLNGNWDIGRSIGDQFTQGQPGFSAGLVLDFAAGSRAARARNRAAHANVRRIAALVEQTIQEARAEVEIAVRDLTTAAKSIRNRSETLRLARAEETFLQQRWEMLGGDGAPAGLVLEDLLSVQQLRTQAEFDLVDAQVEYLEAMVRLQVAMGTLMTETPEMPVTQEGEIAQTENFLR